MNEFIKVSHEEAEVEHFVRVHEARVIHNALHCFGAEKQKIKCIEEMSELTKELCKDCIGQGNNFHVAEEIADVEILLAQMKVYYTCDSTVEMFKRKKLEQLAEKLNISMPEQ